MNFVIYNFYSTFRVFAISTISRHFFLFSLSSSFVPGETFSKSAFNVSIYICIIYMNSNNYSSMIPIYIYIYIYIYKSRKKLVFYSYYFNTFYIIIVYYKSYTKVKKLLYIIVKVGQ